MLINEEADLAEDRLGQALLHGVAKERLASSSSLPSLAVTVMVAAPISTAETVRVLPATWAVAAVELLLAL